MNLSKIAVTAIWVAAVVLPPPVQHQPPPPPLPKAIIFFPAVFFAVASLWGGYPFDNPRLRSWVDRKWGIGAYVRFIQELKPMLLFGVAAAAGSAVCSLHMRHTSAPIEPNWNCGFALSCAVGFLLARTMLARRGLLMESRSPSAWVERPAPSSAFLPAAIQNLRATNTTAFLAGVCTVAGMMAIDAIGLHLVPNYSSYPTLRLVAHGMLLLALVPLFVFGIQHPDRHSLKEWVRSLLRGLCWLLGVIAFSATYDLDLPRFFGPRLT
jgi:hypothetical protein